MENFAILVSIQGMRRYMKMSLHMGFISLKNAHPAFQIEIKVLTHSHTMTPFDAPGKQAF